MSAKRLRCAVIEVTRGDSWDDDDFVVRELPTDGDPYVAMLVRRLVSEIRTESRCDTADETFDSFDLYPLETSACRAGR